MFEAVCTDGGKWSGVMTCYESDAGAEDAAIDTGVADAPIAVFDPEWCKVCDNYLVDPSLGVLCNPLHPLYEALLDCLCNDGSMDPVPGCKEACGDNWCIGKDFNESCSQCVVNGACYVHVEACIEGS